MKWLNAVIGICSIILLAPKFLQAQKPEKADTTKVNRLLELSKKLTNSSPDSAIQYSRQAEQLAEQIGYGKGKATALKYIGIVNFTHGKSFEAVNFWRQALEVFKSLNDLAGVSNILNNIGVVYSIQGDYEKALENYLTSLNFAEQSGDRERISAALNNVGATYALKPQTYDKALDYYLRAFTIAEKNKDINSIGTTAVNIGEVYSNKGKSELAFRYYQRSLQALLETNNDIKIPYTYNAIASEYRKEGQPDLAIKYHHRALSTAQKVDNKLYMVQSLIGLADIYKEKRSPQALSYYKRAEKLAKEISALNELKDIYKGLSATYSTMGQFDNAFAYHTSYTNVKDTLYNIATDKKLDQMEFDFSLQKKQSEINLLKKDKAIKDLEIKKQELEVKRERQAKRAIMLGLACLLLIAFIIFWNYRTKVKVNKLLDRQKAQIEQLLLNILPDEVAKELQEKGTATPRHYGKVSVLFTDFKNFTILADNMSPKELVEELNNCFMAFDNIIEKYDLEKIKTIGDAYMCAGGIPTADEDHPFRIVKAGIEIQDYVLKNNRRREANGLPPWDIRIGIHIGPVVAGVVGKKKYAYDIWGSTVNIASRMESNGAPGKINISSDLYNIIKDKYECSHRGKIYAKNVGEIDMYFIEHEIKMPMLEQPAEIVM